MNQLVGVIGLGYVGLPLVEALLKSDFDVIGFDTDLNKLNDISQTRIQIDNLDHVLLSESLHNGKLELKNTFESLALCRTIIVCVPTPLKEMRPDLSFVLEAAKNIGSNISEGTLVILESTVSPGTTRIEFLEGIQANSIVNIDKFYLAYSPERIDPGNKKWNLQNTPKLLAGINQVSLKKAIEVYSNFIDDLVICNSIEEAELSKLIENSFRLINISFINEIMVYCDKLNIDVGATLKAAATKPYGYMSFLSLCSCRSCVFIPICT
jgi:UDP-N-acetyl-D-glucosamine dehydrogenase